MKKSEELLFRFYFEKSENVLRDRNNFLALFFAAFISITLPLTLGEINPIIYFANFTGNSSVSAYSVAGQIGSGHLTSNFWSSLGLIFVGVFVFVTSTYIVFELKYREYRRKCQKILIRENAKSILKSLEKEITQEELCGLVETKTEFSTNHIMSILRELSKPKPPKKTDNILTAIKAFLSKVIKLIIR